MLLSANGDEGNDASSTKDLTPLQSRFCALVLRTVSCVDFQA